MNSPPTIKDVAKRAGTSISTVSNVLNNRRTIRDDLRQRILMASKELGYVANPIAKGLKMNKSYNIGVIVTDINCIFFAPLLKGIQGVLAPAGYNMMIYDSNYNPEKETQYVRAMRSNRADGIILAGIADHLNKETFSQIVPSESQPSMPIVSIENDLFEYGIDSIFVDNIKSSFTATRHLLEMGCKKIAHITGPVSVSHTERRFKGYRSALEISDLPFDSALIVNGDFSAISGYQAIRHLLEINTEFDGIFAANDQMAVGALRALAIAGKEVPRDVKVVGYDNTFIASIVDPALTTIRVPNYEMGVRAAQLLLDRIENPKRKPAMVLLDYELVVRNSTLASARSKWDMEYW